jgi:DNA-binding SARP family transcriptional activator/DNA-binding beta-propeller fold protein YncE
LVCVTFRVLGPLEVWQGDSRVDVPSGRQRALLACLLVNRDAVLSTDRLVDELWPSDPPATAFKIVRNLVSELRKAVDTSNGVALVTEGGGYRLRLPVDAIDAARFESLAAEGRRLLDAGREADAARTLREALALWRGSPYADVADEPFVQAEAARLDELRLMCLEDRVDAELALGRHAALVAELEAEVRREPLRERLRAQLMLALYRSGRQVDALAAYQDARRTLVREVGLEPGRPLRELEAAILAQDPALDLPPSRLVLADRRRGLALVALGAAALPLLVIAAVLAMTRGEEVRGLASVQPNSVGAIDPRNGKIVAQVPLGAAAARLVSSGDTLWALSTTERTLYRIDAARRELTGSARLDAVVSDVAADGDEAWVLHGGRAGAAVVSRFSADQPVPLALGSIELGTSLAGPGGTSFGSLIDRIVIGDGSLWVTTSAERNGGVVVVDLRTEKIETRRPWVAYGIARGYDRVWLVGEQLLRSVYAVGPVLDVEIPLSSPGVGVDVAVGEGDVWTVTTPVFHFGVQGTQRVGRGILTRVDPETRAVETTIRLGGVPEAVAIGNGSVWITDISRNVVLRVDPSTNTVVQTIRLGSRPTDVAVAGGLVWVSVVRHRHRSRRSGLRRRRRRTVRGGRLGPGRGGRPSSRRHSAAEELQLAADLARRVPRRVHVDVVAAALERLGDVLVDDAPAVLTVPARTAEGHHDGSGDARRSPVDVSRDRGAREPPERQRPANRGLASPLRDGRGEHSRRLRRGVGAGHLRTRAERRPVRVRVSVRGRRGRRVSRRAGRRGPVAVAVVVIAVHGGDRDGRPGERRGDCGGQNERPSHGPPPSVAVLRPTREDYGR